MTTLCRLLTVAAILLHSIFGCGLHGVCACDSHQHGESHCVADTADSSRCDHDDHACHRHDTDGHDTDGHEDQRMDPQGDASSWVADGCDHCDQHPFDRDESPCCSAVQCSFIVANDVEFAFDVGPALFVLDDIDRVLSQSLRWAGQVEDGSVRSRYDDSLSRCALHCSWQI